MAELKQGTTLQRGKYTIVKSLGQGTFSITYLATTKFVVKGALGNIETEINVAIKEFFMRDMNSRKSDGAHVEGSNSNVFVNDRAKFRKEAENLSQLNHPKIVKVLEVFDENDTTYYVMQHIDGENLEKNIEKRNRLYEDEATDILKEVGEAVQYMHSHNMLHLDLKPQNIMRDANGKIFLIDFGLSKQFDSTGKHETSTNIGGGTEGYAPIEQVNYVANDNEGVPVTMDVYALGATMFKMLTGRRVPGCI